MPDVQQSPQKKNNWAQIESLVQLGIILPAATFIGWLLGAGLDRWFHTNWMYIPGLLLGIAAGFVHLIRTALAAEGKE